ncbi:MAG: hypothetical protein EPN88_04490, partial [Bacteroidetes bacterium]
MIDTVFDKFKKAFGFYPTSVGAWWNDSFSLGYMKDKYGITANLTCADQFETDGYHIWGQYWSAPFYPSKYHAGIPAKDLNSKLDLVTIQWAPREPLNGYNSSLYSSQDYFTLGLNKDYVEKLIRLYAGNRESNFGQVTLGLEGDFSAEAYQGVYAQEMQFVADLVSKENYKATNMQQFSSWYRSEFRDKTPDYFVESDDLLGKDQKAIWYQSSNYRVGLVYDEEQSRLTIIDLRAYFNNFSEPYYISPNSQIDLFINIPSVIDSISNPQSKWEINNIKLKLTEKKEDGYYLSFDNNREIRLTENSIIFDNFKKFNLPVIVKNSPILNAKKNDNSLEISPKETFPYKEDGLVFPGL